MSEIFGFSGQDGRHWFNSVIYDDNIIEKIKDPEGGGQVELPTAIPSPFARFDLVRIAFEHINRTGRLQMSEADGEVIASAEDERLVSFTLDFLELFFNYSAISNDLKIIPWNLVNDVNTLITNPETNDFGDALQLFIQQDARVYNFDLTANLYIIKYKYTVIGSTSPLTLFCPGENGLKELEIRIGGQLFFSEPRPLYMRSQKFQRFVHFYFRKYPVLTERMSWLSVYVSKSKACLKFLNNDTAKRIFQMINEIENNPTTAEMQYTSIAGFKIFDAVDKNLPLLMLNPEIEQKAINAEQQARTDAIKAMARTSDLRILSAKQDETNPTLILRNDLSAAHQYLDAPWSNDLKVPNAYQLPVNDRPLPGSGVVYPHLVVGDLLEPVLIRVVYPISKRFFNGNYHAEAGASNKGYLIPLKLKFFDYFTIDQLKSGDPKTPKIEILQTVGAVNVKLHIPLDNGEYVPIERTYYDVENQTTTAQLEEANRGVIQEHEIGFTLFPFLRTRISELSALYRVQLVDRNTQNHYAGSDYRLEFYTDTANGYRLVDNREKIRSNKQVHDVGTKYYIVNDEFDFVSLKSNTASGLIIPDWEPFHQGNTSYNFAIDFGTTNTHIEYRTSKNPVPKPFNIGADEIQIATLFDPDATSEDFSGSGAIAIRESINEEFVPFTIGRPHSEFSFPHRTVLAITPNLASNETAALADYNIPFIYEKNDFRFNSDFETDLKWSKHNTENFNKIKAYFEELLFLIRNKILINKGRLNETKITWFYPTSMQPSRVATLKQLWERTVETYFPGGIEVFSMPESLAPFYYYKFSNIIPGGNHTPAVSIDIGGGTSDVVIFKNNAPLFLTSFKFAANTLFGDAFLSLRKDDLGMLGKHLPHFKKELGANSRYSKVLTALEQVCMRGKSADINAFLFSLESNPKIADKNLFSYDLMLNNDDELKIVFLYFYSAIIYHVAAWTKTCGVEMPTYVFMSGTGSKVLNILSPEMSYIEQLASKIFSFVYGSPIQDKIKIITDSKIPKEATSKGGLLSMGQTSEFELEDVKRVLNYSENGPSVDKLRYDQVNDGIRVAVVEEVERFNDIFIHLNDDGFFFDKFSVSTRSFNYFKTHADDSLADYLADGIQFNMNLDADEDKDKILEESLFFLPLIGVIYNMTNYLSSLK
ncbi:cell division FtsA domain-containing protein [Mucilaginibacter sp. BJC16-A38]|uniref:cell division protein FtsA n=1 Tax=Mucilaginibacter phenanthrenivorans TaxID=1234842 RepID=UPI00215867E9|nr:cell division protein FtsA [Mucilaginibacter phenanthrenivorans]MCR8560395.1 cell division FtsA domain-containing protein [Mucilaginibacter phenanthrenivorans]